MKIAITGTTSGVGKALKDALSFQHEIVCIDRPKFDFLKISKEPKFSKSLESCSS